jgi:hypothetical protein
VSLRELRNTEAGCADTLAALRFPSAHSRLQEPALGPSLGRLRTRPIWAELDCRDMATGVRHALSAVLRSNRARFAFRNAAVAGSR